METEVLNFQNSGWVIVLLLWKAETSLHFSPLTSPTTRPFRIRTANQLQVRPEAAALRSEAAPRASDVTSGALTLSLAFRRLRQQRAGLGAPGLKWCGSERRRLRPCVGSPAGGLGGRSRGRAAHARRPAPAAARRAACCPAPHGLGLRRSARETGARAARRVASPGVPNRRRRPWRSPGGCRRPPANGERAWARLSAPGASLRGRRAASLPAGLPSSPLGCPALGARVTRGNRLQKGFFLVTWDSLARSDGLFSFFFSPPRFSSLVSLPSLNSTRVSSFLESKSDP